MTGTLDAYLARVAKRHGLRGIDIARHQEIIRLLWNFTWAVSSLDPQDLEDDQVLCSELVARSLDVLEKIDELAFAPMQNVFKPEEKGTC